MLHYHVMSEISKYVQTVSMLELSTDDFGYRRYQYVLESEMMRDIEPKC